MVKRLRLSESVVKEILERMSEQGLGPGEAVPGERQLAEELGVGRPALREAFAVLEMLGIIEVQAGKGRCLASDFPAVLSPFIWTIARDRNQVDEFYEVRRILERSCARFAAERATPEDIEEIEAALLRFEAQISAGRIAADGDGAIHYAMAKATHNPILLQMMKGLSGMLSYTTTFVVSPLLTNQDFSNVVLSDLRNLLEAIRKHDPDKAEEAILSHLNLMVVSVNARKEVDREPL
jgi:GntR family transcriptional repressor for pyruvate dehydrogenase complex